MSTVNLLIKAGANPCLTDKVCLKKLNVNLITLTVSLSLYSSLLFQEGQTAERVAAASGNREVYQLLNSLTGEPEVPVKNITELLKVSSRRQSFRCEFGGLTTSMSFHETEVWSCGLFLYYATFLHTHSSFPVREEKWHPLHWYISPEAPIPPPL